MWSIKSTHLILGRVSGWPNEKSNSLLLFAVNKAGSRGSALVDHNVLGSSHDRSVCFEVGMRLTLIPYGTSTSFRVIRSIFRNVFVGLSCVCSRLFSPEPVFFEKLNTHFFYNYLILIVVA